MDKIYVKSIIERLKSTSSSKVQDTLLKIRSKIITNDDGIKLFRYCGGLQCLLPHLRKPNERILDLTLSILGNCCLEEESSITVGKLNYIPPLISILQTVCRDSIVGRACRVIGNLAQRNCNAESLHSHGAVNALITLIECRDKNTSYATLTMAVRAIRQLWMVTEKRDEMLSASAVRCVAILLTTECEAAGVIKTSLAVKECEGFRKSQEELICGILKCLGHFTTYATAQCAEQIQGDGRGYQCLVALTKIYESVALKCLMNLCYLSSCRPLLGTAGMVECLIGILIKNSEASYLQKTEGAARALAQLSGEAVNRSRLRHCGGLPLLLDAARVNSDAMRALLQYVFDETSFQILVSKGLINLLTDELTTFVATMDYQHYDLRFTDLGMEVPGFHYKTKHGLKKNMTCEQVMNSNDAAMKLCYFARRRALICSKNEDELKVVIERDNMIVGFVDAVDSEASDSETDDDIEIPFHQKGLKRLRSRSPKTLKKKPHLIKMASKDWSAGVYWEPKSPEWPSNHSNRSAMSPDSQRAQSPLSPYSEGNQSGFSPHSSSSKRARLDWSPESGFSSGEGSSSMGSPYWKDYQWSPSSSGGPNSPLSGDDGSTDSEISGRYSPVCIELGEEEPVPSTSASARAELEAAQVAHGLDDLIMEDDESGEDDATLAANSGKLEPSNKTSRVACALVLLFRVSHGACSNFGIIREEAVSNHTLELLTGRECLNALLDYVEKCKRPLGRAARILARVLSNALCLMNILKHRLVLRLHSMSVTSKHPPADCSQCKQILRLSTKLLAQLTILAESSYGIGEISYQLLKGSPAMQQTLSITLPYIVRTDKPLKKYFMDCSALNILFNTITESKEEMKICVTALSKLAINVHIKDPKSLENRFREHIHVSYDPILDDLTTDDIVTFELDDSSTVRANKIFLCQNSEVFSAMLMGCFKESVEKCVRLKNVTKPALEYLFTLLHFGINSSKCDVQVFPFAEKLETNLEVLLLADRFLFDKLKSLLSSAILQFLLTPDTADKIYVWSLNEGMGFLCVESVAYLLTGKMRDDERAKCFSAILDLEYREQWLDDIKTMIVRQLVK